MLSTGHKRPWQAPVARTLAVRRTAGTIGPGGDNFMKVAAYGGPGVSPSAPSADAGARPAPARCETTAAADADRRAWEAPAAAALPL